VEPQHLGQTAPARTEQDRTAAAAAVTAEQAWRG
jgi:hypothetical protein